MKYSFVVLTPNGRINVSDDVYGDSLLERIYDRYGDLKVLVYDRDSVFGRGWKGVKPLYKTSITKLFQ